MLTIIDYDMKVFIFFFVKNLKINEQTNMNWI